MTAADSPSRTLNHFDALGQAHMVDVSQKPLTHRTATAGGVIRMKPETLQLITSGAASKGDVLAVARIAAIQAAKKTADLIPLCHPLALTKVAVAFTTDDARPCASVRCEVTVQTTGQTGVEMEALTAASVALLTIYDMCKAVDRGMEMASIALLHKAGGQSGEWASPPRP